MSFVVGRTPILIMSAVGSPERDLIYSAQPLGEAGSTSLLQNHLEWGHISVTLGPGPSSLIMLEGPSQARPCIS